MTNMKKIKYLIHYDINNNEGRGRTLSAIDKADYIINTTNNIGINVDIISASLVSDKAYFKASKTKISEKVQLTKLPAVISGNYLQKIMAHIWRNFALCIYLIKNVKRNESIISYHSLGTIWSVRCAKKIKRFKLILEVEEIYNDVIQKSSRARLRELKFISCADKYIFPTEMLNVLVNKQNKPYTVIHGTYKVEHNREVSFNDGKIHIVYAGTFDPRKGGALAAVSAAELLSSKHHIHIIGFGGDEDIKNIKERIDEVSKISKANITYDGLLSGEEYVKFIQSCDIGLSTQNPDAAFNDTSFPSKILSYMANGLRVVTVRIPAIESSAVGRDVYYYDKQTPQAIAEAIMKIDLNDGYDGRKRIKELDIQYKEDMTRLLGGKNAKYI